MVVGRFVLRSQQVETMSLRCLITVNAKAAYQDFLTLWEADPDIPILKQAKAEYACPTVTREPQHASAEPQLATPRSGAQVASSPQP